MPKQDIDKLITSYLEGALSPEQAERFSDWLTADPSNAQYVAKLGLIERGLNQHFLSQDSTGLFAELALMEEQAQTTGPIDITDRLASESRAQKRAARKRKALAQTHGGGQTLIVPKAIAWIGLAAVLGLIVWAGWPKATDKNTAGSGRVTQAPQDDFPAFAWAQLLDGYQIAWDTDFRPGAEGFTAGRYRMTDGEARLRLIDGTHIKLIAPIEFTLGGHGQVSLYDGQLVADVPPAATGFTVHTPAGDIVDVGTTFGVEVIDGVTTEAEVIDGLIRVAATTADGGLTAFVDVTDDQAVRLDKTTARVESIQAGGDRFSMDYVRVLDLVDAVAGGDGTTGRRNAGIDPLTGDWQDAPFAAGIDWTRHSDRRFHPVDRCPLVAGIFIPVGNHQDVRIDPAGRSYSRFTASQSTTYGQIWAGGYVPVPGAEPELDTIIQGVNYAAPSRGLVRMHANSGLCFDLAEMRRRNPGLTTARFRTGISNREATRREPNDVNVDLYASVDVWVFIDGELRYTRRDVTTADGLLDIDLSLDHDDQYLTVVITDGLNGTTFDWVLLCQPRIDLRPSDRP
ncbi:MAG: FecR domain-containing protein [Planctomycetota bacterium]